LLGLKAVLSDENPAVWMPTSEAELPDGVNE
jgi:hypothetical protein